MGRFYAIKVGKGVNDIIVKSWKECQEYVIGFPSIYKSFSTQQAAKKYLKNMDDIEVTRKLEISKIYKIKRIKKKIQEKYSFTVPDYILEEIISTNSTYEGILELIEFAVKNQHISFKNSLILKKELLK